MHIPNGGRLALLIASVTMGFLSTMLYSSAGDQEVQRKPSDHKVLMLRKSLEAVRESHSLPAMWAGKFYRDGRTTIASTGVRKLGEEQPVEDDDLIHLGSCTKSMTALLIAQMISAGKLRWDSSLGEIFTDIDGLDRSPWSGVTISDLMHHHSGAPANAPWAEIHKAHSDDPIAGRRAVVQWLVKQRRPTKIKELYSNTGYSILGHIAEHIQGKSWEDLISDRIFKPIGITTHGFGPVVGTTPLGQPWGHSPPRSVAGAIGQALGALFGGKPPSEYEPNRIDNPSTLGPAGIAHMSLADWAKFVSLYATKESPDERLNISKEDWNRLLSPDENGAYAGGWNLVERPWADGTVLWHNGSNTTWYCVAWVAPENEFFSLVATNCFGNAAISGCDVISAELLTTMD